MNAMMGSSGPPKSARRVAAELPDDLMHAILSKLDFKSKLAAGQVCKKWDQLLKAGSLGARHWEVHYNIDSLVSSTALTTTDTEVSSGERFNNTIGRCVTVFMSSLIALKSNWAVSYY